jgi:hypothetical protein
MSHWLVGEPEAGAVAQLVLHWLEARDIAPKRRKPWQLSLFGWDDARA